MAEEKAPSPEDIVTTFITDETRTVIRQDGVHVFICFRYFHRRRREGRWHEAPGGQTWRYKQYPLGSEVFAFLREWTSDKTNPHKRTTMNPTMLRPGKVSDPIPPNKDQVLR